MYKRYVYVAILTYVANYNFCKAMQAKLIYSSKIKTFHNSMGVGGHFSLFICQTEILIFETKLAIEKYIQKFARL